MLLRQLVDAGTLSNLPGGFKARGLRIKGDDTPIGPGEWRDVDAPSGTIRDNLMPLPYKEPSQVLAALMDKIIDEGRRFASAADMKVSDMSANSPVGSTLAILERTLKVMSAVNARIYYSMKKEFGLLKNIIRDYTDPDYRYNPATGTPGAKQDDYNKVNLIPVADPNAATMAQKVVQYQAVMQMAQQNPTIYDLKELNRQMLQVLGVKNIDKLIKTEDDAKRIDPVSENMNILNGTPVKAFIEQDHEAHLAVHLAFMNDPKVRQMVGQSVKASTIQGAIEAHIAEHMAFEYRKQLEEQLGVPLPPPDEELPEDIENEIARLSAAGAEKLLQKNTAEIQQQKQQQLEEDPIVQMQKAELELKKMDAQAKTEKTKADITKMHADSLLEEAKLQFEKEKLVSDYQRDIALAQAKYKADAQLQGAEIGAKAEMEQQQINLKEVIEGAKLGAQAAKAQAEMQFRQKESQSRNATKVDVTKLKDDNNN